MLYRHCYITSLPTQVFTIQRPYYSMHDAGGGGSIPLTMSCVCINFINGGFFSNRRRRYLEMSFETMSRACCNGNEALRRRAVTGIVISTAITPGLF